MMHKKITHLNKETGDYFPQTDRYYVGKQLLLEVEDASLTAIEGESVCINGVYYDVDEVVVYPEIMIQDIHLVAWGSDSLPTDIGTDANKPEGE